MASFRLGPLKSPNRRLLSHHNTPPFSIDPSHLQVSLEQTQGAPSTPQANRSSGKSSPLRGRCVKEYEEQLQQLQHENFNLKLRVFLLEERVGKALGRTDAADIIKNNIELKVENETLKKSLAEKCQLLSQASGAIEELENQQRSSLAAHQAEILSLQQQIQKLQKDLADAEEIRVNNRASLIPDESTDLYAQAFGSFLLNPNQLTCNHPDHHTKTEMDQLQAKIDQLVSDATVQLEEMAKLTKAASHSQVQLQEYQQRVQTLESNVANMESIRAEKDLKIANLTSQLDSQTKAGKISDVRQPAVEKDKIIEEKQQQLEQQNKILVEIQITLDEKQKQIAELEGSLNDKKKKVGELEKSLSKAGRSLQGFVTDIQKKEKELEHLKAEGRKKDKRVKDLTAELKEAQELINKTKWETEVSSKEDNIKAMAEEENERLWAELEEKKKLLSAAEQQRAVLQHDADQLASLKQAVDQKEQAVAEAEMQISILKRQVMDLQQEMNSRSAIPHRSDNNPRHSLDSMEQKQPNALATQLAAYVRERKELTETIQSLKNQLVAYQNGDVSETATWKKRYEESQEKAKHLDVELQRLKAEVRSWKKKAETNCNESLQPGAGDHQARSYKKELTVLRQRLADSTNACDLLRTRLEEMADFLEEILSMSQQELLNLSNWSAASKRRQALQHSILQSRELSRTLSQSLMIGIDPEEQLQHSGSSVSICSNSSAKSNEHPVNSSREKSVDSPPATEEIGCQVQLAALSETKDSHHEIMLDQLRTAVIDLEHQIKLRDEEIAKMKMANPTVNNKSMQTDRLSLAPECQNKNMLISSTPYHRPPAGQTTSLSPVALTRGKKPQPAVFSSELFPLEPTDSINYSAKESTSPRKAQLQPKPHEVAASESEAWSEPDRTVSFARIGLPFQHHVEMNSIAALLTNKKPVAHSNAGLPTAADSSDSSKRAARRSKSDPCEVKRSGNRLRLLEQENSRLRSQLKELVSCLRSTYDVQFSKEESLLLEESQVKEDSLNGSERRNSIDDLSGAGDIPTAQYIINALKNRLLKMKDVIKRRDLRLREAKDVTTQLEFKIKEKYFQACENQLLLKETQERLVEKNKEVELLEARWIEAQSQWMSTNATKERQIAELRGTLDARETELRTAFMKAQLWETSYNDGQKTMRQVENELKSQQELLIQSMSLLEQQVRVLKEDLETVREERNRLQNELENLREQTANANVSRNSPTHAAPPSTSYRNNSQGIQRQASQMSDYVSDPPFPEDLYPVMQAGRNEQNTNTNTSRPSALHLSPDLGIDSDPGRFSSLEHSAVEHKDARGFSDWTTNKVSPKQTESTIHKDGVSPDVLNSSGCASCTRWENKYIKAKHTLAATLEKLQAANVRKEKVDRALNKELGKTHNILCQARGLLEQANHGSH
ncbi:centrosomin-like [Daphnia carinata]|uniref:centrosomin-like n=1 Tax=Daphnia carinata TaxID=120202 RepID=UPI0025806293|nr:centrosomin-like [Daphnia carinata]